MTFEKQKQDRRREKNTTKKTKTNHFLASPNGVNDEKLLGDWHRVRTQPWMVQQGFITFITMSSPSTNTRDVNPRLS